MKGKKTKILKKKKKTNNSGEKKGCLLKRRIKKYLKNKIYIYNIYNIYKKHTRETKSQERKLRPPVYARSYEWRGKKLKSNKEKCQ